jgi:hypothetical protein
MHFYHAPLGGENRLADVGLGQFGKTDFNGSAAFGGGGRVAPAANVLFRLHFSGFDEQTEHKDEHRRDAYDTLDSATFVPLARTAL